MKKILSTLCMALVAVAMSAQAPVITFDEMNHDFGVIYKEDGNATHVFTFTNEGMDAITVVDVRPGCGCTSRDWTKGVIEPGQKGTISAIYRAASQHPGHFNKSIAVTVESANSKETTKYTLRFHGELKSKEAEPGATFPVHIGALGLKNNTLEFGAIRKGDTRADGLEFANISQEEHTVALFVNPADAYLIHEVSGETVKPNEMGKFSFSLNSNAAKVWGPQEIAVYVVLDGKKVLSDEFKLTIRFNMVQDFSQMSVEEKQNAPILEVPDQIDLGKVAAGKTLKYAFPLKNTGVNPLEVLRVYSNSEELSFKAPKAIKSGKKGALTVEVNAKKLKPGEYVRDLNIICNDYQHSVKRVKVSWTVE